MEQKHTYSQRHGSGEFSGWSYLGLAFKVTAKTTDEATALAREFTDDLSNIVDSHPAISDCDSLADCIACFTQCIEAGETDS